MIRSSGWMQAVIFNSLLILMPVIAAQTLGIVYAGVSLGDTPRVEAIEQTRRNMDQAFENMAPRNGADRMRFWSDIVSRELAEKDVSAARGFLLAAPVMLNKEDAKEIRVATDAESDGTRDEKLARVALRKLPYDASEKYNALLGVDRIVDTQVEDTDAAVTATTDQAEPVATQTGEAPAFSISAAQAENSESFALLGTYADLATNSERWLQEDRVDPLVLKITALGLIQSDSSDQLSASTLRAASIVKSARRSRRMTTNFQNFMMRRLDETLPDDVLRANLEQAMSELVPMQERIARVRQAYVDSIDPRGLARLENELDQIDRLGALTRPAAAVTLLEIVEDGSDLRRIRLITEAGGDRSVALVKQTRRNVLKLADTGIRLTTQVVLQLMGLTASGLLLIFVMLSTLRQNFRRRPKLEML